MSLRSFPNSRFWLVALFATILLIVGMTSDMWSRRMLDSRVKPLIHTVSNPPATAQCANCHREICERFPETGHARSLWRGDDKDIIARFVNQEYRWTPDGPLFRYVLEKDGLWFTQEGSSLRLHVDWVLGSGSHTQGPVQLFTNSSGATEMWEHAVAWYPSTGLGPALGNDEIKHTPKGMAALANWQDHSNAKNCLGCHSTQVPIDGAGKIQTDQLIGTVGCVRCHPDAAKHIAQNGAVSAFRDRWSQLPPHDVVNRCGECHRRADETNPGELDSERLDMVRFAPVGLSQSRCFKSQYAEDSTDKHVRLDCLSCHDLHRPLSKDRTSYHQVCFSCHYDEKATGRPCKSQPQTSDCVSCHMPLVATDAYLKFTDHWIRVRKK